MNRTLLKVRYLFSFLLWKNLFYDTVKDYIKNSNNYD